VLAAAWQGEEQPRRNVDLTRITTSSLPALKAYLEGESLLRRSEFAGAVAAYQRAVAADSTFAFALYHLSLAAGWAADAILMVESYRRALRHADRLPERESILLRATYGYNAEIPPIATAIQRLEEVIRRYPDDVDAWYFLGESYWHYGKQALASPEESERAFRKVIELDPGFTPAAIHLVNNAFLQRPDSARAARLIDEYHRLAPNSPTDEENRVAFGLAFGDSTRRAQSLAALDTLPIGSLSWLADGYLDHPRFWREQRLVLERRELPEITPGLRMQAQLFENSMSQGLLRAARSEFESPLLDRGFRVLALYTIHSLGLPVAGIDLDQALSLTRADREPADAPYGREWFYAGAYAAEQGRWQNHAAAVSGLRADAHRLLAAGDSSTARFLSGAALALEGQGLWRRGDAEQALQLLIAGQRQALNAGSFVREAMNGTIRWWIAELLLEMERPSEAAKYFAASWNDPWAAERLGPIYERIGEPSKAREAYALVATAWRDADPELQPRVRRARAALERLDRMLEE
jgi:serine/threonine-protein kinase